MNSILHLKLRAKGLALFSDSSGALQVRKARPVAPVYCDRELPDDHRIVPRTVINQPRLQK